MPDPLLHELPLPHQALFHPLGFPLRLATNAPALLEAARASWDGFPVLAATAPLEVRIAVSPGGAGVPPAPVFRAQRHLMAIVSDAAHYAICDHQRAFAFGWLSEAALRDPDWVRYYFLEAIAFHLLTQLYVTPVHAACLLRGSRGVLLCGDSGAGKSCLAYACARQGWTYASDNDSWLLRACSTPTVRGDPRRIRLREGAIALFPEIAGYPVERRANGKQALSLTGLPGSFQAEIHALVLLARGPHAVPDARTIGPERVGEMLASTLVRYDDPVSEAHRASLDRLARLPRFELRYSDARSAARLLDGILESA